MKHVTVKSVNGQVEVALFNTTENDALTAKMARAAREIAFGVGANATVSDGETSYRVTRSGTRRMGAN